MRRKTTAEKTTAGTYRADRDRTTPQFSLGAERPKFLTNKVAKAEWNRVAPLLEKQGILQQIDQSLLATYCLYFAHWQASEEDIAKNGLIIYVSSQTRTGRTEKPVQNPAVRNSIQFHKAMLATSVKFGISPLDRPRIEVPPDSEEIDPLEEFLNRNDDDD